MSQPHSKQIAAVMAPVEPSRVTRAILDFVSEVPASRVGDSADPAAAAQRLASRAAQRAALTAGSLALPPGPLGWLTLLPELIAIWRIQAQMVSDIAAAYGRHATLGREQMLWCLFRHTAAQAFRDLVVQVGDRLVFRRMSHGVVQRVAKQVGSKLSRRALGEGMSRWLPVIGALGVGAYAYVDTTQVARTAITLFSGEAVLEGDDDATAAATAAAAKPAARKQAAAVRRAAGKLGDSARGAARKAVGTVRKAAARKPRPPTAP